jgi:hypothetical protein
MGFLFECGLAVVGCKEAYAPYRLSACAWLWRSRGFVSLMLGMCLLVEHGLAVAGCCGSCLVHVFRSSVVWL